jgi:hypothetical protein
MNKIISLVILAFGSFTVAAQCNEYYALASGSELHYDHYNHKGKLSGKNQQKVIAFTKTPGGFEATVNSVMFDEKGKEVMKGDLEFKCDNGTMYIDMRKFISQEQLKAFSSYEMKVESENLEIPSNLSVGQSLKDGSVTVTATGGPFPMKMTVTISDRKIEAKESVATPAGTFDCLKITNKTTLQNQMGVTMTTEFSSVEWIAPKIGVVKSESYNKNGKSNGYVVLSKVIN